MDPSQASRIESLCALGQEQLMRMEYLSAEKTLARAEAIAWELRDFDSLSRLYMPLQEARRQRRQRCGEGIVCLDLIADGADDQIAGRHVVDNFPHGQLLIAGWGSIQPAIETRQLAAHHDLYLDTFLAAVYPIGAGRVVAIVPTPDPLSPSPSTLGEGRGESLNSIDSLIAHLPAHSIVMPIDQLPKGSVCGTPETYGRVMAIWEQLHAPFLATADSQSDPLRRIEGYRKTIQVDYACELAHQKLADAARELARTTRPGSSLPAHDPR